MEFDSSHIAQAGRHHATKSAINPTLSIIGLFALVLGAPLGIATYNENLLLVAIFSVPIYALIAFSIWQLGYFTRNDPQRLQREEHVENMLAMERGGRLIIKDGGKMVEFPVVGQLTSNPDPLDLQNGGQDDV